MFLPTGYGSRTDPARARASPGAAAPTARYAMVQEGFLTEKGIVQKKLSTDSAGWKTSSPPANSASNSVLPHTCFLKTGV